MSHFFVTAFILNITFVTIYTTVQKLVVSSFFFVFFFKKCFIQQGFVKLIETVIVKIDIVENISILNKCWSFYRFIHKWTLKKYQRFQNK